MHPVSFRFPPRLSQLADLTKTGVTKGGRMQATSHLTILISADERRVVG